MEIDFIMGNTQVHIFPDGYTEVGNTTDEKWIALSPAQMKELIGRWLLVTHEENDGPKNFTIDT